MNELIALIVPKEILEHFDYDSYEDQNTCFIIRLIEKNDIAHIPKEILHDGKAVLDGFMNTIELQTYPLKGKEVFLELKRRRWKKKGTSKGYFNTYDFNEKGIKATREFGSFLKEIGRI